MSSKQEIKRNENVVWHHATVTRERRAELAGHRSTLIWFTGLSGSGKSTVAHALEETLFQQGIRTMVLDGDNVRHGLNADLGFSDEDRHENIRRLGEVSKLFVEAGVIVLTAFISPFRSDRERVMDVVGAEDFIEIYCRCPLDVCEQRDVKGLYKKARKGEISQFTGITSPYEEPKQPHLVLDTDQQDINISVSHVLDLLLERGIVSKCTE